jgi:hypothetical protein
LVVTRATPPSVAGYSDPVQLPIPEPVDTPLPERSRHVDATLADGRVVAGSVVDVAAGAVWFRTEEHLDDGTELMLVWGEPEGAREAPVVVYPSARRGVVFAKVQTAELVERRSAIRTRPAVALLARIEPILRADGMGDAGVSGVVIDVSTSGVAVASERRLPVGTAVTVGFRSRQGEPIGGEVPGRIVRFERRDPRFLVAVQFEAGKRQRAALNDVLAACG